MESLYGYSQCCASTHDGWNIAFQLCIIIIADVYLTLKFFTLAIVNSYRVWMVYINCDNVVTCLQKARSGESSPYEMRQSAKQILRRDPFHLFTERGCNTLIKMAGPGAEDLLHIGARSPDRCRSQTTHKRRRRDGTSSLASSRKRLYSLLRQNKVRMD